MVVDPVNPYQKL